MTRQGDRSGPSGAYGYGSGYGGRRLENTPDALSAPRQQAGRARKGRNQTGKEMISCNNLSFTSIHKHCQIHKQNIANDGSNTVGTRHRETCKDSGSI